MLLKPPLNSSVDEILFSFQGRGQSTFKTFKKVDETLGRFHQSFRSIHVGGTNGKGSVCLKIARSLEKEGFKVGLYTSPHLEDFRERITINGEKIPLETAETIVEALFPFLEKTLSFFDVLTLLAFRYFQQEKVDYAVIEVGLGGRLDATNVITPILSVITSIGWDHMEILGNTLEAIAKEKGGIIKRNVPLVVGPSAVPFFPKGDPVEASFPFFDLENQEIAKKALSYLGIKTPQGLSMRPRCRFEEVGGVILDVAHNPDGFEKLNQALCYHYPNEIFDFIVAFSKGKDPKGCLSCIAPRVHSISYFASGHEKLYSEMEGIPTIFSLEEAIPRMKKRVVITGSFYIMHYFFGTVDPVRN